MSTARMSRRAFVAGGAALATLAACTGRTPRSGAAPSATSGSTAGGSTEGGSTAGDPAGTTGASFVASPVIESRDGVLTTTLEVAGGMVPYGTGQRWAMTYAGTSPGPTLRVRPGDRLRIRLVNRLDQPTNLHTHGLRVDPGGASDNPFVMVGPGESHDYDIAIPADHPSGLFWYHPHHHGTVAAQVGAGLAGAIVVTDAVDAVPLVAGSTERVLVLGDPRIAGDAAGVTRASAMARMEGRVGDGVLVNGERQPVLTGPTGRVERLRLVNATPSRRLRLSIDGARWWLMATDAGRLDRPRQAGELTLSPGERIEVLVPLAEAGTAVVTAVTAPSGAGMGMAATAGGSQVLARIEAIGAPAAPPSIDVALAPLESLDGLTVARTRTVALAMGMGGGGMGGGRMGGGRMTPTIDGRSFDGSRTDATAALGTVEDWTITATGPMAHPFHLHVWPFQVTARSDGRAEPGWKDVVDVPAGGWVRIRIPFRAIAGRTVYHCHILDHEDMGMMGVVEVH